MLFVVVDVVVVVVVSIQLGDWQKLPSKVPKGHSSQPFQLKEITRDTIVLEVQHFCKFGLSANQPQRMKFLMFMNPKIIQPNTDVVYVSTYAVQESLEEVCKIYCILLFEYIFNVMHQKEDFAVG